MSKIKAPFTFVGEIKLKKNNLTKSDQVGWIQCRLLDLGYSVGSTYADKIFGANTQKAVKQFVSDYNSKNSPKISTDGSTVTQEVWNALFKDVKEIENHYTYVNSSMYIANEYNDDGKTLNSDYGVSVNLANKFYSYAVMTQHVYDELDTYNLNWQPIVGGPTVDFKSYIIALQSEKWFPLPVIPEQVTKSVSNAFSSTAVPGKSYAYQTYAGTNNRTFSFSLKLHYDLLARFNDQLQSTAKSQNRGTQNVWDMTRIVEFIEALAFPEYSHGIIKPPLVVVKLTDSIKFRGVVNSVQTSYELPFKRITSGVVHNNQHMYNIVNMTLNFTEIPMSTPSFTNIMGTLQGEMTDFSKPQ